MPDCDRRGDFNWPDATIIESTDWTAPYYWFIDGDFSQFERESSEPEVGRVSSKDFVAKRSSLASK